MDSYGKNESEKPRAASGEALLEKRGEWRRVRKERLALKERLAAAGLNRMAVRRDPRYRKLEKEQDRLTAQLRHMEKRLNRKRARQAGHG
jgi:hypothetical protein